MGYFTYMNRICQGWQDHTWRIVDDLTPYCNSHRDSQSKTHQSESTKDKWFRFYCGERNCRLRKFYWNIHPKEWPFKEYPRARYENRYN